MGSPAVRLGDQADDREAEAGAALAPRLVGAAEAIKSALEEFGWKASAPIRHVELHGPVAARGEQLDIPAPYRSALSTRFASAWLDARLVESTTNAASALA